MPPPKLTSPPSTRALARATEKPFCVKSTRARVAPSNGVSGVSRRSLPASVRLPLTLLWSGSSSGIVNPSLSSAGPVAVVAVSASPSQPPIGVVLTKRSISASGPRPLPSTVSTACSRFGIPPCTPFHSTPPSSAPRVADRQRQAVDDQFAADMRQRRPGRRASRTGWRRLFRHEREGHVVDLRGDAELAGRGGRTESRAGRR